MNVYALPTQLNMVPGKERIVAIGVFDGVHIGHRAVLTRALNDGRFSPAVFTFGHTSMLKTGAFLQTEKAGQDILEKLGFEDIFVGDFAQLKDLSPAEFVQLLADTLHAKAVVCGFNFRFGKNGAGDTVLLKNLCEQNGIELYVQPPVMCENEPVSTTRIKAALAQGDMQTVLRLQGHPYTIRSIVEKGAHLGTHLGAPTINQSLPENIVLPCFGVYAAVAIVHNKSFPAVTNIGVKPTVGADLPLAETYILDFDEDLYGETVLVHPISFIRPEKQFTCIDDLKQQIAQDIQTVREIFAVDANRKIKAVLFDFDNTLQDRDEAVRRFYTVWLKKHFPDISGDALQGIIDRLEEESNHGLRSYRLVFEAALSLLPFKEGETSYEEFQQVLKYAYPANTVLFPDAISTITALREKGVLVGVITNGYSHIQNAKLDAANIRPLLDVTVVSGDIDIQKPNAEPFRRAAMLLGMHPENCIYVGDNPVNDIEGAKNAGMQPVFLDLKFDEVTVEDPEIPHIYHLKEILDCL